MTKNNDAKNALDQQKQQEQAAAIARLPEFKTLDLTDDPEQVKKLIRGISTQAAREIAVLGAEIGSIENQEYLLVGRCFSHMKTITDKGKYQEAIKELGYTYDEVKFQVKTTETYIKQLLTRKKDTDVLLGPGKLGTMARIFRNDEMRALGDGKKVYGLRDKDLEKMSQRDVINHVRAARAERDTAIQAESKKTEQLKKANDKSRNLEDELRRTKTERDLILNGPESVEEANELCANIRSHANAIARLIHSLSAMAHSGEIVHVTDESVAYAKLNIQINHDEFHNTKSDVKHAAELKRLRILFGYKEEED